MKRVRQPFFRPSRKTWFVQLDGKQINLGPDEDAAWTRYHELMAQRSQKTELPASTIPYVVVILDQYIEWLRNRVAEGTKAKRTYDWYFTYAALFEPSIKEVIVIDPPKSHKDGPHFLNVLRVLDIPEALGLLAPTPLTIIGGNDPAFDRTTLEDVHQHAPAIRE
jgi:hypothetical protein